MATRTKQNIYLVYESGAYHGRLIKIREIERNVFGSKSEKEPAFEWQFHLGKYANGQFIPVKKSIEVNGKMEQHDALISDTTGCVYGGEKAKLTARLKEATNDPELTKKQADAMDLEDLVGSVYKLIVTKGESQNGVPYNSIEQISFVMALDNPFEDEPAGMPGTEKDAFAAQVEAAI